VMQQVQRLHGKQDDVRELWRERHSAILPRIAGRTSRATGLLPGDRSGPRLKPGAIDLVPPTAAKGQLQAWALPFAGDTAGCPLQETQ